MFGAGSSGPFGQPDSSNMSSGAPPLVHPPPVNTNPFASGSGGMNPHATPFYPLSGASTSTPFGAGPQENDRQRLPLGSRGRGAQRGGKGRGFSGRFSVHAGSDGGGSSTSTPFSKNYSQSTPFGGKESSGMNGASSDNWRGGGITTSDRTLPPQDARSHQMSGGRLGGQQQHRPRDYGAPPVCRVCKQSFESFDELKRHIRAENHFDSGVVGSSQQQRQYQERHAPASGFQNPFRPSQPSADPSAVRSSSPSTSQAHIPVDSSDVTIHGQRPKDVTAKSPHFERRLQPHLQQRAPPNSNMEMQPKEDKQQREELLISSGTIAAADEYQGCISSESEGIGEEDDDEEELMPLLPAQEQVSDENEEQHEEEDDLNLSEDDTEHLRMKQKRPHASSRILASTENSELLLQDNSVGQGAAVTSEGVSSQGLQSRGTCEDMCPAEERIKRVNEMDVHKIEESDDLRLTMIKKFQRSSADHALQIPHLLRTPATLLRTINYIEDHLMDMPYCSQPCSPCSALFVYLFIWDRYRMIAKDFTLQQSALPMSMDCIECHERMARWFIYMDHKMQAEEDYVSGHAQQNGEQLNNLLKTLHGHYFRPRREDGGDLQTPNKTEFICYFIIFQLGNKGEVSKYLQQLPRELLNDPHIRFAVEVWGALKIQNYAKFFRLFRERATLLQACLMHRYMTEMRLVALRKMTRVFSPGRSKPQAVTIYDLMRLLIFDNSSAARRFLEHCGFQIIEPVPSQQLQVRLEDYNVNFAGQQIDNLMPRDKNDNPIMPVSEHMKHNIDEVKNSPQGRLPYSVAEISRGVANGAFAHIKVLQPETSASLHVKHREVEKTLHKMDTPLLLKQALAIPPRSSDFPTKKESFSFTSKSHNGNAADINQRTTAKRASLLSGSLSSTRPVKNIPRTLPSEAELEAEMDREVATVQRSERGKNKSTSLDKGESFQSFAQKPERMSESSDSFAGRSVSNVWKLPPPPSVAGQGELKPHPRVRSNSSVENKGSKQRVDFPLAVPTTIHHPSDSSIPPAATAIVDTVDWKALKMATRSPGGVTTGDDLPMTKENGRYGDINHEQQEPRRVSNEIPSFADQPLNQARPAVNLQNVKSFESRRQYRMRLRYLKCCWSALLMATERGKKQMCQQICKLFLNHWKRLCRRRAKRREQFVDTLGSTRVDALGAEIGQIRLTASRIEENKQQHRFINSMRSCEKSTEVTPHMEAILLTDAADAITSTNSTDAIAALIGKHLHLMQVHQLCRTCNVQITLESSLTYFAQLKNLHELMLPGMARRPHDLFFKVAVVSSCTAPAVWYREDNTMTNLVRATLTRSPRRTASDAPNISQRGQLCRLRNSSAGSQSIWKHTYSIPISSAPPARQPHVTVQVVDVCGSLDDRLGSGRTERVDSLENFVGTQAVLLLLPHHCVHDANSEERRRFNSSFIEVLRILEGVVPVAVVVTDCEPSATCVASESFSWGEVDPSEVEKPLKGVRVAEMWSLLQTLQKVVDEHLPEFPLPVERIVQGYFYIEKAVIPDAVEISAGIISQIAQQTVSKCIERVFHLLASASDPHVVIGRATAPALLHRILHEVSTDETNDSSNSVELLRNATPLQLVETAVLRAVQCVNFSIQYAQEIVEKARKECSQLFKSQYPAKDFYQQGDVSQLRLRSFIDQDEWLPVDWRDSDRFRRIDNFLEQLKIPPWEQTPLQQQHSSQQPPIGTVCTSPFDQQSWYQRCASYQSVIQSSRAEDCWNSKQDLRSELDQCVSSYMLHCAQQGHDSAIKSLRNGVDNIFRRIVHARAQSLINEMPPSSATFYFIDHGTDKYLNGADCASAMSPTFRLSWDVQLDKSMINAERKSFASPASMSLSAFIGVAGTNSDSSGSDHDRDVTMTRRLKRSFRQCGTISSSDQVLGDAPKYPYVETEHCDSSILGESFDSSEGISSNKKTTCTDHFELVAVRSNDSTNGADRKRPRNVENTIACTLDNAETSQLGIKIVEEKQEIDRLNASLFASIRAQRGSCHFQQFPTHNIAQQALDDPMEFIRQCREERLLSEKDGKKVTV